MKKFIRFAAAALSGIILLSAVVLPTGAARFDSVDSNTAVAGASVTLRNYLSDGEGSAEDIAAALTRVRAAYEAPTQETEADVTMPETIAVEAVAVEEEDLGEILYAEPVVGVANVMSVLNVRKDPTTLSDIVEYAVRGAEITVLGEMVSNHVRWYKVRVNEAEGYVAGNLVVFGEDAEKMQQIVEDESGVMPENFEIVEDLSSLDEDLQERVDRLAKDISYVLRVDYPQNLEEEEFANTYSILIYLIELLTQISDIANEQGMNDLYTRVDKLIGVVEFNRQKLSEMTGYSDQDFEEMIADSKAKAEEERQAYIRAQQEADAARAAEIAAQQRAYEAELARQQAELAAQQAADEEARRKAEEELLAAQAAADQAAADVEAQAAAAEQAEADAAA